MKKYLPALVSGFAAAVITTVPVFKELAFCLIIPAAAGFSLFLYQKTSNDYNRIPGFKVFIFGLLTAFFGAIFSTFFDVFITLITHTNSFVESLPDAEAPLKEVFGSIDQNASDEAIQLLRSISADIRNNGFSALYTMFLLVGNLFIYSITGLIGAFLGMLLLNKRNQTLQK